MPTVTSQGINRGGCWTRPLALTPNGRLTVQLIKLEAAFALLSETEQADVLAELEPIVRVAQSRATVRQPSRVGLPLVGRITV